MGEKMNVLCFITKATSSLDYLIPMMECAKRVKPSIQFKIVIWGDKRVIFRNQKFYQDYLEQFEVYDINDLVAQYGSVFQIFMCRFFIYRKFSKGYPALLMSITKKLFSLLRPDLILYDHRETKQYAVHSLKKFIECLKIPTVLLPHAPHHTGTEAFVPFFKENILPDHFYYWTPFKHDNYHTTVPGKYHAQLHYAGYPGFDTQYLKKFSGVVTLTENKEKKFLLIIRKIFPKKVTTQPPNHDNYAFFYNEFLLLLKSSYEAIEKVYKNFSLYLKPHPSTNLKELEMLIKESKLKNVFIDNDSIYNLISKYDYFLSFYTTTILIPMASHKVAIIIDSRIQEEIRHWDILKTLYDDAPGFVRDAHALSSLLLSLKNDSNRSDFIEKSYKHLRNFYPDEVSPLALSKMEEYVQPKKEI
jgi:hypothetical protein